MKKRRRLKIFLLTALIIIIGVGSYLLYEFKFKKYDVADEAVTEIMADPYTVELPNGSKITIDENGNVVEDAKDTKTVSAGHSITGSVGQSNDQTQSSSQTTGSTDSTTANSSTTPTVGSIKEKYIPALQGLEAQADTKINALVGRAKGEYQDKKANGESINFGYFYNKYMAAAKDLETSTDAVFYGVLAVVEKDLVANGFDKSYAKSFKEEYEATKKARRDSLLNKALGK